MTEDDVNKLVAAMGERTVRRGEVIVTQGDPGTCFYVIKAGAVAVTKNDTEIARLSAGQFFGERSLITTEPANASVAACEDDAVLLTITKAAFEQSLGSLQSRIDKETRERSRPLPAGPQLQFADLRPVAVLGEGSFATVKLVEHTPTKKCYALKCMYKGHLQAEDQVDHVIAERTLLAQCTHTFLLNLVTVYSSYRQVFLLLELALGGELFSRMAQKKNRQLSEADAKLYAAMVVSVYGYLHEKSIAHRDLKPENLLFDAQGYLKLIDFGFAKKVDGRTWTLCGTPEYLAPEIISNKGHGIECDWWGLGILVYEMLAGTTPFASASGSQVETYRKIISGNFTKLSAKPYFASDGAAYLVSKLLVANPALRCGCGRDGTREVRTNGFFSEIDWGKLERREYPMPFVPQIEHERDVSNFDFFPLDKDAEGDEWDNEMAKGGTDLEKRWREHFTAPGDEMGNSPIGSVHRIHLAASETWLDKLERGEASPTPSDD